MPKPLMLSDHTVNAINATIEQHNQERARELKGAVSPAAAAAAAVAWFTNIGGIIRQYLPEIIAVLQAVAARGSGQPTWAEFVAIANEIESGAPPAGTKVVPPTPKPA